MESDNSDKKPDRPWLFKKGQSGNPVGRPKGSVGLKTWAKEYLSSMNEEERMDFMDGLPKEVIWKMAEGNPHNTEESKVEVQVVTPIYGNKSIQGHDSDAKDIQPAKEN